MKSFEKTFSEEYYKKAERLMDLEASGKLIELPCAPGSTIYVVKDNNGNTAIEPYVMGLSQIIEHMDDFGYTYFEDFEDAKKAAENM